jgi:hypothetical protein
LQHALVEAQAPPIVKAPPFKVIDLEGSPDDWGAQLNNASSDDYQLLVVADGRAILTRS